MRRRIVLGVLAVAVVAAAGLAARLSAQERAGPPHLDVVLADGVPATLYVPGEPPPGVADRELPDPQPAESRPPVVVLAHGFAADRAMMSSLARSLTAHGYAVIAFDWRGHGENRNGFERGELDDELRAVVDAVAELPYIDRERIILMGHSMGAGAVLDLSTRDPRPAAVVPISGGFNVDGPVRPPNVLFVVAEDDPQSIHDEADHLAARLADVEAIDRDRTYGEVGDSTAVRVTEVPGRDHLTVLWSSTAVNQIIEWLDDATGLERDGAAGIVDGRLGTSALYLAVVLVLLGGLGALVGWAAPPGAAQPGAGWRGLLPLGVAGVTAGALTGASPVAGFVPLAVGDAMTSLFLVSGVGLLVARAAAVRGLAPAGTHRWLAADRMVTVPVRPLVLPIGLAVLGVVVLMAPVGGVYHRLIPTPERFVALVVTAALLLPFTLAFQLLVRRGRPLVASLAAVAGRVVILLVAAVLIVLDALPPVVELIIPVLAAIFVLVEIFAAAVYAKGRNVHVIAGVEAIWLAWLTAATLPIG